jgi:DNA (cytosine-5)-methyltransferase 1
MKRVRKTGRPRIEDRAKTNEVRKPWLKLEMSRRTWCRRTSIPGFKATTRKAASREMVLRQKRNVTLADIIEDAPTGVSWRSKSDTDQLLAMMAPLHLAKVEAAQRASLSSGTRMVGGYYRRMRDEAGGRVQRVEIRFDDVAGCLRTAKGGGSSIQDIMVIDGDTVRTRRLSPREAARLMGLPDDYKLPSDYVTASDLMGDGVAVPAVRHLAEHILEPLLAASIQKAAE